MEIMKWAAIIVGIVVGLWLIDRMFLAFEDRGWIYWRKKKASAGTVGNALLELQSIMEPSKKEIVKQMHYKKLEIDEKGEPIFPNESEEEFLE